MTWPTDYLNKVICGNCLDVLAEIPNASIDSIVTDPPYGLSFMGKHWDYDVPTVDVWRECLRVLKPGGHLLSFSGTRTYHRMAVNIEDAGFEIRDMIAWVYGSGFPKSLDVSKAIDKMAGVERNNAEHKRVDREGWRFETQNTPSLAPATESAKQWSGWGTALKPALEPICVARKPLIGTVAENVLQYGTGGINIDGCRVEGIKNIPASLPTNAGAKASGWGFGPRPEGTSGFDPNIGRFPANLIHDGSEEVLAGFPESNSGNGVANTEYNKSGAWGRYSKQIRGADFGDSGSAARFFYCAKASKEDRDEGCEGMEERRSIGGMKATGLCRKCGRQKVNTSGECECAEPDFGPIDRRRTNHHPTVKPTALMRYLCRLVTPPGGIMLDPFLGSGSTGKAAKLEYFNFIGIEREAEYCEIARKRIDGTLVNRKLQFQEARP